MSSNRPSMILDAVKEAFNSMGQISKYKTMNPPAGLSNTGQIAWEYHVASELERLARARKQHAHELCVDAGVMFDHIKHPKPPGTEEIIYDDDFVQVQVKVNKATEVVDQKQLMIELQKRGVPLTTLRESAEAATRYNKAAHMFRTILKGGVPPNNGK